ncbi:MAG: ABC transporter ATP-binding protein [Lachnospiraceae bacterium]|jgi:ATP-binding cassette subfamily B protein|nr:ABC transporter ATP-binding protein [Lachnospiraceae bacterium]
MRRLLAYLKPHKLAAGFSLVIVLVLIALELYRPLIIGDAIDTYINAYYKPYGVVKKADSEVNYHGVPLAKKFDKDETKEFYQVYLWKNTYYLFRYEDASISKKLNHADNAKVNGKAVTVTIDGKAYTGQQMSKKDIRMLRIHDLNGVKEASLLYLIVLVAYLVCDAVSIWVLQKMGQDIVYEMRNEVYSHVLTLDTKFFNQEPVGKLVTRVTNDTEAINELFSTVLVKLFRNVVKIIGFAVVMLSINVKMTGLAFMMLPIVGGLTFFFRYMSRKAYRMVRAALTDLNTFLSENLSGMRLIQIFTREKEKYEEFNGKNKTLFKAYFREQMTFAIFRPSIYALSVVALIIIMGFGGKYTLEGSLTVGTLYIFINYIRRFFEPIQELAEQFGTLQSSLASAEKIFTILDEKPTIVNGADTLMPERLKGEITFENVWFAYEDDEYVLKDINFTIKPGERVAFVGATGAGKSSILNLIGRYYDIQEGAIKIDGKDIKEYSTNALRGNIGQVQQDVFIFTGDIKSNITLNNPEITREQMMDAAKYVNADGFIRKLPQGYDEPVSERGATFSAGQRQLLSFARTLAYNPSILVLDEATANIDTETESLITEALQRLMEGRTTIMVAHRLSTIQHADKIMVMDKGKIMESGTHQELLAKKGIYYKLYELQLASVEE